MAVRGIPVEQPKCLRLSIGRGPFTVRAQWRQFGVRVRYSGRINVRGQSPKKMIDLRQLRTALVFSFIIRVLATGKHDH